MAEFILDTKDESVCEEIVDILKKLDTSGREKVLVFAKGFQTGIQCSTNNKNQTHSA